MVCCQIKRWIFKTRNVERMFEFAYQL